ncbi:MAG: glycine zipper family protein [Alphaproteobacteria bacterium]|nr:glycine zipper family protein [Alphaproteobacteria bacterium]
MKSVDARLVAALAAALAASSCVPVVMAPMIPVMPGPGKAPDAFNADVAMCRQYADAQVAPLQAQANSAAVGSALIGTVLGAGLGAAVGGGRGAAIGAASGAVVGTGVGAANAQMAGMTVQQQYDIFYSQCMYGHGNQVPGFAPGEYGLPPYPGSPPPGAPVPPPYPPYR